MSLWTYVALLTLTTYRVTRLLVVDEFPPIHWVRVRLAGDDDGNGKIERIPNWIAYLVTCYWCMSVWVSGALTLIVCLVEGLPVPLLVWGSVAALAAWLSHLEDYLTGD